MQDYLEPKCEQNYFVLKDTEILVRLCMVDFRFMEKYNSAISVKSYA